MSSTVANAHSVAVYASLFFLCQTGPLPVSLTWSQADNKKPSRGIITFNPDDVCFYMNEFQIGNKSDKDNKQNGFKINKYRMGPGREVPSRGPPESVSIQAFFNEPILVHMLSMARKSKLSSEEVDLCLDVKRVNRLRAVLKNYTVTVTDSYEEAQVEPMLLHELWSKQNFVEFNQLDFIAPHEESNIRSFLDECVPAPEQDDDDDDTEVKQRLNALEKQVTSLTELMTKQRADTKEMLSLMRQHVTANRRTSSERNGRASSQRNSPAASPRTRSQNTWVKSLVLTNCRTWGPLKEKYPSRGDLLTFLKKCFHITEDKLKDPDNRKYYREFKTAFYANIEADLTDPANDEAVAQIHRTLGQMTGSMR